MGFIEERWRARGLGLTGLVFLGFFVIGGCGDDASSPGESGGSSGTGAATGGSGGNAGDGCLGYCSAYRGQCAGSMDCAAYCTMTLQAADADCLDELASYHACALDGPFQCDAPIGMTPTGCGLSEYAACEQSTQPACQRAESYDTICASRGSGLVGFLCTVARAPQSCVKTNPDNVAALQSMCCPLL